MTFEHVQLCESGQRIKSFDFVDPVVLEIEVRQVDVPVQQRNSHQRVVVQVQHGQAAADDKLVSLNQQLLVIKQHQQLRGVSREWPRWPKPPPNPL